MESLENNHGVDEWEPNQNRRIGHLEDGSIVRPGLALRLKTRFLDSSIRLGSFGTP